MQKPEDLTLCLSGGGFRAMLFHLGVIRALRDLDLLGAVRNIFSVSGGSIAAAHLVLNWERYTATNDAAFQGAVNELVDFARMDLRGKILRRAVLLGWIPPFYFARTAQLSRHYHALFNKTMLESLNARGRPKLHILTTNIVSGEAYYFDANGICKIDDQGATSRVADAADLQVGTAVAASSAFPPFFPPVTLKARTLGVTTTTMRSIERFTDGGVFDNTGVRAALTVSLGRLVVSDASAGFDQATDQSFSIVVSRAIRSSDILMSRVAALEDDHLRGMRRPYAICKISEIVTKNHLQGVNASPAVQPQSAAVQKWIKNVRTDLDRFPIDLIRPIFRHGYEAGLSLGPQLSSGQFAITRPPWTPGDTESYATTKFRLAISKINEPFRRATTGVAGNDSVATEQSVIDALKRGARRPIGWWTASILAFLCTGIATLALKFLYWDQRARPPDLSAPWDAVDAGSARSDPLRRSLDGAGLWPITQRLSGETYAFLDQKDVTGNVACICLDCCVRDRIRSGDGSAWPHRRYEWSSAPGVSVQAFRSGEVSRPVTTGSNGEYVLRLPRGAPIKRIEYRHSALDLAEIVYVSGAEP